MRERQRIVGFDEYEEGALISALNDLRNKEIAEGGSADFIGEIILKILDAPIKRVKVRDEAR